MIPPLPNISNSGTNLATSAHFFSANGLRTDPVVPPGAYLFSLPTPTVGSPLGSGSYSPGIVLVKVTALAPPSNAA